MLNFLRFFRQQPLSQKIFFLIFLSAFTLLILGHDLLHKVTLAYQDFSYKCLNNGQIVEIVIKNRELQPKELILNRCDKLEITNQDKEPFKIALGEHENHLEYPDFEEKVLGRNENYQFLAKVSGKYKLHNHFNETIFTTIIIK